MNELPMTSDRPAIKYEYFPTLWQAVLFRNWNHVPLNRIANVLKTTEETLIEEARLMGLPEAEPVNPRWDERGYLTLIRENWHLLPFHQLTALLNMTEDMLAFILKEDDFMWHKMGQLKPLAPEAAYAPLTSEEREKTNHIVEMLKKDLSGECTRENAFEFCDHLLSPLTDEERAEAIAAVQPGDDLRTIYSYFALYGDPLLSPELDPFPERLLAEYAKMGVKGVWLQGILYQLVPFPFAPEISKGWEIRMDSLRKLVKRAAQFGIGVYLYMNEPRAMDDSFFKKYPHLRGIRENYLYSMCTSQQEVKDYLENSMEFLFREAEGLAGFFTITMSENLTNCISRAPADGPCPRCLTRKPEEIVAEVNNLMARGAHKANPNAKAIAWNWAWGRPANGVTDDWSTRVPPLLTEGQIVQCTSENNLPTNIGGIEGRVSDYTISLAGPGPVAKAVWKSAIDSGHETCAKVQINNSWELAAIPYLPVFDRVAAHMNNLKAAGVKHLQLSWTLGGAPSPSLKLASQIMSGKSDVYSFMTDWLGKEDGETAFRAQEIISRAFQEFPFSIGVLYMGPQNFGPMAPFFLSETGWNATMVGFPYDNLKGWRSIYPENVFEDQLTRLVAGWTEGTEMLRTLDGKSADLTELCRMAEGSLCHFESMLHQVQFVRARNRWLEDKNAADRALMLKVIEAERATVLKTIAIRRADSRIGYEASNHYFYTMRDLNEKLINLRWCQEQLEA